MTALAAQKSSSPAAVRDRLPANVGVAALTIVIAVALGLLVVRFPRPLAVGVAGLVAFATVAVLQTKLLVPIAAAALLLPGTSVPLVGTSTDAIVLLLALVWVIGLAIGRWRLHRGHALVVALTVWLGFNYLIHPHDESVLSAASDLRAMVACLVLAAVAMSLPIATAWLLRLTAAASLVLGLITIRSPRVLTGALGTSERAAALGLNSNYLGQLLATCLIASLALVLLWRERWALVPAAVAALALLSTESRGALVALFLTGAVLLWSRSSTTMRIALVAAAVLFVAFGPSIGATTSALLSRENEELDLHNEARADAAITAGRYLVTHPLDGVGYGEFANVAATDPDFGTYVATHNDWLRIGAETGVVGLALLAAFLLPGTWLRGGGRSITSMRAILICGCTGLLFGNLLSAIQVSALLWIAAAMLWAERERRRSTAQPADPTEPALPVGRSRG